MDRKIATGVGVAAALAASPSFAAAVVDGPAVPIAASYSELLQPIPDAQSRLARSNAEMSARPAVLIQAQYAEHHHHHHHHSNDWYRQNGYQWSGTAWLLGPPSPQHHHHHHHHSSDWYQKNGYYLSGGAWLLGPPPQHHHHHHHNNY